MGKFYRAGANYVVSTDFIGWMRLASEMIRPPFLDPMLRGQGPTMRVAEVTVAEGSRLVGQSLGQARLLKRAGLLTIAIKHPRARSSPITPVPRRNWARAR